LKIRLEIDFIFKNEPVSAGVAMSELSNGTKKHTSTSRETIPLSFNSYIDRLLRIMDNLNTWFRLTFHSDRQGERRGFAVTFQPVRVGKCGGSFFVQEQAHIPKQINGK
jgi:hypothetical protein